MDDSLEIVKKGSIEQWTDHLNQIDTTNSIKFPYEVEENNSIPFLDTLIVRRENGPVKLKVYRKKTHTNQYLAFESHHPLHHKMGVVRTLLDRCEGIVSEEGDREEERKTIKDALSICGYPAWTLRSVQDKIDAKKVEGEKDRRKKDSGKDKNRGMVILPYIGGISEKLARILKKRKVTTAMRPHTTLKNMLVHPKDKTDPKEGVYTIDCESCDMKYVGETKRVVKARVKEHRTEVEKMQEVMVYTRNARKASETTVHKSAITDHVSQLNHLIDWDSAKLVERERDWTIRGMKEAMIIRKNKEKCMNRDEGRYNLSHLYDDLLTPDARGGGGHH